MRLNIPLKFLPKTRIWLGLEVRTTFSDAIDHPAKLLEQTVLMLVGYLTCLLIDVLVDLKPIDTKNNSKAE
jgi:hypothetical protein